MGNSEFHKKKISDLLVAYEKCEFPFTQGVCLFYVGVHAVDYCLALHDLHPSTHRGRKRYISEKFDENVYVAFEKLLADSLQVRYDGEPDPEVLYHMRSALRDLIAELSANYGFPPDVRNRIVKSIE